MISSQTVTDVCNAIDPERLVQTAVDLIAIPSPTRSARRVADFLAQLLQDEKFAVERPVAGWSESPAVAARFASGTDGKTLQFNGHLDTVHLPFVPPRTEDGLLYGSGASDMKGGVAAMIEALRVLRETDALTAGSILLTAHDLHERPWGDGSQVNELIASGFVGDAVLLPEYLSDRLPLVGRGQASLQVEVTREGVPVHEVLGGIDQPSVITAGAELICRLRELDTELSQSTHPLAGRESVFVGQVHAGEMFNQSPTKLELSGTRRWLPSTTMDAARAPLMQIFAEVAQANQVQVNGQVVVSRDAYEIAENDPLVAAFQGAHEAATGHELPVGSKPFVDDGNAFVRLGGIPAITHGPAATGAHTVNEQVPVEELVRVATVYALTAISYCNS